MMKKAIALLLMLIFLMSAYAMAEKQVSGTWNGKTVFSMGYDDKSCWLDKTAYVSENTATDKYQFMVGDNDYYMFCFISYYDYLSDFSSYLADEKEMQWFIEDTLEAYSDVNCKVVETYIVSVKNGKKTAKLPFLILRVEEEGEVMYHAEIISHGYSITFDMCAENAKFTEEKMLSTLKAYLDSFIPVSK